MGPDERAELQAVPDANDFRRPASGNESPQKKLRFMRRIWTVDEIAVITNEGERYLGRGSSHTACVPAAVLTRPSPTRVRVPGTILAAIGLHASIY